MICAEQAFYMVGTMEDVRKKAAELSTEEAEMTSRKSLTLRILSPEGTILEVDEASSINVPVGRWRRALGFAPATLR